ncbi:MAG: hypothetical protein ACRD52_16285 [Candidatus Acidiferrales bacterium]
MSKRLQILGLAALAALFLAPAGRAQDNGGQSQQPVAPEQPVNPPEANAPANTGGNTAPIPAVIEPDFSETSLTGAQLPTFGLPPRQSYFVPRFDFFSTVNTNGLYASSASAGRQLANTETLLGGITLERVEERNQLSVNFLGGRAFSPNGDIYNTYATLFGLTDKWISARWTGTFSDQLSYMSDPLFNSGGFDSSGLGFTGVSFQPTFLPNQGIVVGRTPVLNNSSVAELDYQASPRASFTFVGSYFLLHYYGAGLTNTDSANAQAGYNYRLSAVNTIGVLYRFGAIRFGGNQQSVNDNVVQMSFAHQIAQRLRFQVGAGPDVALIQLPGSISLTHISWSMNANLAYHRDRTGLGLTYAHLVTGGSGILLGSEADLISGNVSRDLSRNWGANATAGYTRSSALVTPTSSINPGAIDSLTAGGGVTRTMGENMHIFLNYTLSYQISQGPICSNPSCGTNLVNHAVSAGFSWHPGAYRLE